MKLKYDSRKVDRSKTAITPPKPGVYRAKVTEANFEKAVSGSHGDRIVFVARMDESDSNGDGKGYGFWDYVPVDLDWKIDNWLRAVGFDTESNETGEYDVPKSFINKLVRIRVKSEHYNDEYRPKLAAVLPYLGDDDVEAEDEDFDEDELDEEGEEEEGDEEVEEDEDEGDEGEEEDILALGADADDDDTDAMERLTELAAEHDLDPDDFSTWALLAKKIDQLQNPPKPAAKKAAAPTKKGAAKKAAAKPEPEPSDDGDGYDEMSVADLKAELESRDLPTNGSKSALIARLRANDEDPFT